MPDSTVITDTKDTKEVLDPTKELKARPIGQEVREKSFQQILKEEQEAKAKPTDDAAPVHSEEENKKADDEKQAKEAEDAKRQIEADEADRKRQAELATKAADEAITKLKKEEQDKIDAAKKDEEKVKRQEALKPKFTGVDKDGNVVPKDYDEITKESARIAREETLAEVEAREAARQEKAALEAKAKADTEEQQKASRKAFDDQLQTELDADLTDLYANNKLPKIKDPKDENDEGNKEFKNLFETAQRVNAERIAKGEPPIRSIKLIYYEHYKPLGKPAGHNAPVLGSESPLSHEPPEDRYIPSRDRNKTMGQLLREEKDRLAKKMNIRGV